MTTYITDEDDYAREESTYVPVAAFTDADGDAVTPKTLTWTLTDKDGTVINSREDEVLSPDTSVDIVLSGDDLSIQTGEVAPYLRYLLLEGTYDSDEGSDMPLKDELVFPINNLLGI